MEIKKVGVLGCGLMGSGIAQTAATAGFETIVREVSDELCERGFGGIEKSLARFAEKGTITSDQQQEIRGRLSGTTSLEELRDCDIIIEAIIENLETKRETYRQLDSVCKPETIFASNTSSISITEMMTATSPERQRRFIGMHFFNPVPLMKLVEVIRTILTDEAIYEQAIEFGKRLGKVPVRAGDKSGFIVNRLLVPYMLDAVRALEEGVGSIVDIDNAMLSALIRPTTSPRLCSMSSARNVSLRRRFSNAWCSLASTVANPGAASTTTLRMRRIRRR